MANARAIELPGFFICPRCVQKDLEHDNVTWCPVHLEPGQFIEMTRYCELCAGVMNDEITGRMPGVPAELRCKCGFVAEKPAGMARHQRDCPIARLRRVPGGSPAQAPATLGHSVLAPNTSTADKHTDDPATRGDTVLGHGRMICPGCGAVKSSRWACKACGLASQKAATPASEPSTAWRRIVELRAMLAVEESRIKNTNTPDYYSARGGNNYSRLD